MVNDNNRPICWNCKKKMQVEVYDIFKNFTHYSCADCYVVKDDGVFSAITEKSSKQKEILK